MKEKHKQRFKKLGQKIACTRVKKGMSKLELAKIGGWDERYINKIEQGMIDFSFATLLRLCEILDTAPEDLFDFQD